LSFLWRMGNDLSRQTAFKRLFQKLDSGMLPEYWCALLSLFISVVQNVLFLSECSSQHLTALSKKRETRDLGLKLLLFFSVIYLFEPTCYRSLHSIIIVFQISVWNDFFFLQKKLDLKLEAFVLSFFETFTH
jgi:hypothetical protein